MNIIISDMQNTSCLECVFANVYQVVRISSEMV